MIFLLANSSSNGVNLIWSSYSAHKLDGLTLALEKKLSVFTTKSTRLFSTFFAAVAATLPASGKLRKYKVLGARQTNKYTEAHIYTENALHIYCLLYSEHLLQNYINRWYCLQGSPKLTHKYADRLTAIFSREFFLWSTFSSINREIAAECNLQGERN